jgi:hypothetical protein
MRPLQGSAACTLLFGIIREGRKKKAGPSVGLFSFHWSFVLGPFAVQGFGEAEQVLPPVDTEFVIYAVGVFGYAFRQYVHFLRYFRAAKAPHDTVRYLIFTLG